MFLMSYISFHFRFPLKLLPHAFFLDGIKINFSSYSLTYKQQIFLWNRESLIWGSNLYFLLRDIFWINFGCNFSSSMKELRTLINSFSHLLDCEVASPFLCKSAERQQPLQLCVGWVCGWVVGSSCTSWEPWACSRSICSVGRCF